MKKILLCLLILLCIIALGVGYYAWKFMGNPVEVTPIPEPIVVTWRVQPSVPESPTFEDDFYQDLSDFFGNNQGYENIQGEYGFTTDEK